MCVFDTKCTGHSKYVYIETIPTNISPSVIHDMIEYYVQSVEDQSAFPNTRITDMRVKSVRTGYGSFTEHHFDDSDYLVDFIINDTFYSFQREAVLAVHNGRISLWMD